MRQFKSILLGLGLLTISLVAFSSVTSAQSLKTGDSVTVAAGETVDSLLFVSGNTIDIAGTVNGDVFCGGQNVTITGTVNGDVFCAAQTISISGKIEGSVRLASQTITLGGSITGDVAVASQTVLVEKGSTVGRDFVGGVQSATINGLVGRDLAVGAETLAINGVVGRNVKGEIQTLTVGSSGVINGDAIYSSTTSPVISAGGKINGTVTRTAPEQKASGSYSNFGMTAASLLYTFVAVLILGLVVAFMLPKMLADASSRALGAPGRTVLIGFAAVIMVPALIILLMISVLGLPVALLVLLGWLVVVLLTGPFVGYVIGRIILKDTNKPYVALLLGLSILLILSFIPILGILVTLSAYIFGVGVILPEFATRLTRPVLKKS